MSKLWLIAKSNMKKRKGNIVTLFILVVIAVVLMYSSLNVLTSVQGFLKVKNEKQNGAYVTVLATPNYEEQVVDIMKNIEHFQSVEMHRKLQTTTTCDITDITKDDEEKDNMMMLFGNMEEKQTISNWKIVDEAETKQRNSIVLPMYLKVAKGYQTGDEIQVKINHITKKFVVYGFTEDVMFATPSNITIYTCQVTAAMFEELQKEGSGREMYQYNVRLDSAEHSAGYEGTMSKQITAKMTEPDFGTYFVVNFTMMLGGTTMMINIIMAILALFSVIMTLIVVLVIRFNMMMYLEENLANIGIMEAQGFTTRQLRSAMLLEYMTVGLAGIVVGLLMSGVTSAFFSGLVSGSIGLTWTPEPNVVIALVVSGFLLVFVSLIVLRTASRLRKITTLDALRGGIQTHNFKKNHMPLENTKLGLNTSLGLKSLLHQTKQNIAVIVIVALLSFSCVLSMLIYYNFTGNDTALLTLVGIEKCDVEVASSDKSDEELSELLAKLEKQEHVDHGVLYGWQGVTIYNDQDELAVTADVYSDFDQLRIHTVYEGREPVKDNEMVITSVIAKQFGVETGDSIQVRVGDVTRSYVICGVSQQISNMGVRAKMTKAGAVKLNKDFNFSGIDLYVNGDKETTLDVVESLKSQYKEDADLRISNINESFDTIMGTFSDSLQLMCAVFVLITGIVVVLIILLIMRMKMVRERKSIGVYKALGFTTKQIVWQMVMAFAPVVTLGGILGAVLGALSINKVFVLALSFCQIKNASLSISMVFIMVGIALITVLAFGVSALISFRTRKIEPYQMIVEE